MTPEREKEWVKEAKQNLQQENELNKIISDLKFLAERHIKIDVSMPKNVSIFRTNAQAEKILELCEIGNMKKLVKALENLGSTSAYIYSNRLQNLIK